MIDLKKQLQDEIMEIIYPLGDKIELEAVGSDGFSLSYRANIPMLSASLIKLPILLYAYKNPNIQSEVLDQTIHLDDDQIVSGSGVLQVLSVREWTIRDLLALMISVSDNTATNLLMDFFGIHRLQKWIEDQGLTETSIERKMMDMDAQKEGRTNWISAHDANWMIQQIFSEDTPLPGEAKSWLLRQQFRDKLPGLFDEKARPILVYNKTGEMEQVDHDAAYFSCDNEHMAVTVLTSGCENRQDALFALQQIGQLIAQYLLDISESVG
ncbi:class A beta-lactamase-related serine hydrolase [Sporolactobacillus sp. CPB3-1]|uniref:Class A beta-lactamase-related serine hydrolase n=1 Tax=Sporolactobacillus mangiferae TaxID=2940498 RepID=A0ABT0MA59_9BACL|nr:serine hydrolase [Sporolactobacillus mangiferae]MCL1631761.1 class A beta-lactamase-related serine hydrolase [Sporolactobacillus mangiferae]